MAAPVPATPLIAWLNAVAGAAGLHFDVALANASPDAVGRPPAPAAAIPYTAPLHPLHPLPPLLPPCHDRANHGAGPGPCLSAAHNPGGPGFQSNWPSQVPLGTPEVPCHHIGRVRNIFHGNNFMVCRNCLNDNWAQPWATEILQNVTAIPPALPAVGGVLVRQHLTAAIAAAAGGPVWRNFMTRMCRLCEDQEIRTLRDHVTNQLAGTAIIPAGAMITTQRPANPGEWPYVTCTCLEKWHENCGANSDVCIQHRHREACAKHDELLIIRAQNDKWLRDIRRVPGHGWHIERARGGTTSSRANRGIYRVCRCGMEPRVNAVPRVYQCLGCEGVIHITRPPLAGPLVLPANFPNRINSHGRRVLAGEFYLRRRLNR